MKGQLLREFNASKNILFACGDGHCSSWAGSWGLGFSSLPSAACGPASGHCMSFMAPHQTGEVGPDLPEDPLPFVQLKSLGCSVPTLAGQWEESLDLDGNNCSRAPLGQGWVGAASQQSNVS